MQSTNRHGSRGTASLKFGLCLAGLLFAQAARAQDETLAAGTTAPAFTVKAHDGRQIELSKLKGKYVVLYFYPRDDTPGCTVEAKGFRDNLADLKNAGVEVLGVSTDGNDAHKAFADKYELPFALLPDEKGDLALKYAVPLVNNKARRITYLIGPDGKIAHAWQSVKPDGHAQEILARVAELGPPPASKPGKKKGKAGAAPRKKTP